MRDENLKIRSYIEELFGSEANLLREIKKKACDANIPNIGISQELGRLLFILTKIKRPKRILEIGTLVGYSTAWLALSASKKTTIISLEKNSNHVNFARENLSSFKNVEIIEGDAKFVMQEMIDKKEAPFDLILIDADKQNYPVYLDLVLKLSKKGSIILSDDLIPKGGELGNSGYTNLASEGIYAFNRKLFANPTLTSTLMTMIDDKGRIDAFSLSIVSKKSTR